MTSSSPIIIIFLIYVFIFIVTMIKPKATLRTRFPYSSCCKSRNMSCTVTALCSSEHSQVTCGGSSCGRYSGVT